MVASSSPIPSSDSPKSALRLSRSSSLHDPFPLLPYVSNPSLDALILTRNSDNFDWKLFFIHLNSLFPLLFLAAVRLFKRTKSNTIVITGLNGAGKTVLFYQVGVAFLNCIFFPLDFLGDFDNLRLLGTSRVEFDAIELFFCVYLRFRSVGN